MTSATPVQLSQCRFCSRRLVIDTVNGTVDHELPLCDKFTELVAEHGLADQGQQTVVPLIAPADDEKTEPDAAEPN